MLTFFDFKTTAAAFLAVQIVKELNILAKIVVSSPDWMDAHDSSSGQEGKREP